MFWAKRYYIQPWRSRLGLLAKKYKNIHFNMVSFRGPKTRGPRPDRSPLGVSKFLTSIPTPFICESPPASFCQSQDEFRTKESVFVQTDQSQWETCGEKLFTSINEKATKYLLKGVTNFQDYNKPNNIKNMFTERLDGRSTVANVVVWGIRSTYLHYWQRKINSVFGMTTILKTKRTKYQNLHSTMETARG